MVSGRRTTNSGRRSRVRDSKVKSRRGERLPEIQAPEVPSGSEGWSRELKVGVTQLVVVAVVFASAALWNASRDRGAGGPSLLYTPALEASVDESRDEDSWLEGGAVRTLRSVTRSLDFSPSKAKPVTDPRRRARTKSFKGRLHDYELPVPSPRRVQRATERRVGNFLHRDLRFSSGESLAGLVGQYREHLEAQGYEVQQSQLGGLSGQGAELIAGRGTDKATVKLKVGADGNTVAVAVYERIEALDRR